MRPGFLADSIGTPQAEVNAMKASMTKVDDADPTPPPSAFVQIPDGSSD